MNKNILMILSIFVVALFLTGCSQQTASPNTNVNTNPTPSPTTPSANNVASTPTPTPSTTTSTSADVTPKVPETIKDITIEAHSFGFTQTGPAINKGDKVRITFTVTDGRHSLLMPGYNIEFQPLTAGQTESAIFVADKSGTFEYHCNNPCGAGHADMVGNLVVN
jgi:cytochrome c oxidase subunit II